jgi:phage baseplate assembly protein W
MALARQYKDLNLSFLANPVTKDIAKLTNEAAVKRSIRNIIMTNFYERFYNPSFGSSVSGLLFEPLSFVSKIMLERAVERAIARYEPRASVIRIDATINAERNGYSVSIIFKTLNSQEPISIELFLQRVK